MDRLTIAMVAGNIAVVLCIIGIITLAIQSWQQGRLRFAREYVQRHNIVSNDLLRFTTGEVLMFKQWSPQCGEPIRLTDGIFEVMLSQELMELSHEILKFNPGSCPASMAYDEALRTYQKRLTMFGAAWKMGRKNELSPLQKLLGRKSQ